MPRNLKFILTKNVMPRSLKVILTKKKKAYGWGEREREKDFEQETVTW